MEGAGEQGKHHRGQAVVRSYLILISGVLSIQNPTLPPSHSFPISPESEQGRLEDPLGQWAGFLPFPPSPPSKLGT